MKNIIKKITLTLSLLYFVACGNIPNGSSLSNTEDSGGSASGSSFTSEQITAGAALYDDHCARCHSSIDFSSVMDSSADLISRAIDNNWGGMGSLASLSTTDIEAIAAALSTSSNSASDTGTDTFTDDTNDNSGYSGSDDDDENDGEDSEDENEGAENDD